jgi:DNA-binding transcriptional ArsR family regulator
MIEIAETLRALGDQTRLRILRLLMEESLNVSELTSILGLAQPTVSKHLRELKKSGLVEDTRTSGYSYYCVSSSHDQWWNTFAKTLSGSTDEMGDLVRLREVLKQRKERAQVPDRFVVPGRSWAAWSRSLRWLLPPLRVADFGCGDGTFSLEIAGWAKKVWAIDCNTQFLKMAKKRAAGIKNIQFLKENMEHLSLRARSVDLVIISHSLHYVEQPLHTLREAHRVLTSGGRVLILDLLPHQEEWVLSQADHRWLGLHPSLLEEWLEQSGFHRVEIDTGSRHSPEPFRTLIATGIK